MITVGRTDWNFSSPETEIQTLFNIMPMTAAVIDMRNYSKRLIYHFFLFFFQKQFEKV